MRSTIRKKTAAIILLAAVFFSLFTACAGKNPKPEDTIFKLQDAINHFDAEACLECIDSKWSDRINSVLSLTDRCGETAFLPVLKTLLPVLPLVQNLAADSEAFPEVAFQILHTEISGSTATVELSGTLSWHEYTIPFTATADMKLENNMWVVSCVR